MKTLTIRYNGLPDHELEADLMAIAGKPATKISTAYPKYANSNKLRAVRVLEFECSSGEADILHAAFVPVVGVEVCVPA